MFCISDIFLSCSSFSNKPDKKVSNPPPEASAEIISTMGNNPPNQLGRAFATAKIEPSPPSTAIAMGIPISPNQNNLFLYFAKTFSGNPCPLLFIR